MNLFGLSFILCFFKLSYGSNFWNNLGNDDINLYRREALAERVAEKLRKHELDVKFLVTAHDTGVYPKFTRWKSIKNNKKKFKSKFYGHVLLDEVNSKRRSIKEIRKEFDESFILINNFL